MKERIQLSCISPNTIGRTPQENAQPVGVGSKHSLVLIFQTISMHLSVLTV